MEEELGIPAEKAEVSTSINDTFNARCGGELMCVWVCGWVCVGVCVCVCVRERERVCVRVCERERERVCVCVYALSNSHLSTIASH